MKTLQKIACIAFGLFINQVTAQIEALKILPNGNIGIGTSTPSTTLEVNGDIKANNGLFKGKIGIGTSTPSTTLEVNGDVKANNGLFSGNIGIGTSTPSTTLEVNGDVKAKNALFNGNIQTATCYVGDGGFTTSSENFAAFSHKNFTKRSNNYALLHRDDGRTILNASEKGELYFKVNDNTKMILNKLGNRGIGTTASTQAKLVVSGNIKQKLKFIRTRTDEYLTGSTSDLYHDEVGRDQVSGDLYFRNSKRPSPPLPIPYSIYASDRIAASTYQVFSDVRVKNILGISNAEKDLKTLSKIEITDYIYIDILSKGNQTHKKIIAQQIKKVYPQAVSNDLTEVIPNIYQLSSIKDGWINIMTKDVIVGDTMKLVFSEEEAFVEVLEVTTGKIKVASNKSGEVFVYGKQVSDFHTVDYEAISMLNVSATQALLKRIEILEKEKKKLTNNFESYKSAVATRFFKIEQALEVKAN